MKKLFYILFLSLISVQSYGLFFHNKHYVHDVDPHSCKYSQIDWYEDEQSAVKRAMLPSKNDIVILVGGSGYTIEFDQDINVSITDIRCNSKSMGKKLKFAKKLELLLPEENQVKENIFDKCQVEVGDLYIRTDIGFDGIFLGVHDLKFIDSTLKATGALTLAISSQSLKNQSGIGGLRLIAQGKSKLEFKQGIRLDSIALSYPKFIKHYVEIQESNGNMPEITFGGNYNDLVGANLRVRCTPNIKKGKYNIVNFTSKAEIQNPFQNVIINGKTVAFGESVQIGELTAKVYMGASGSDKAENDYILEIK